MPEYKIFWMSKPEISFVKEFTTETKGTKTYFIDTAGNVPLTYDYGHEPDEKEVDRKIAEYALLDPAEVYAFARANGATGGLGERDLDMTEKTAELVGEEYSRGLTLIKWEDYIKRLSDTQ